MQSSQHSGPDCGEDCIATLVGNLSLLSLLPLPSCPQGIPLEDAEVVPLSLHLVYKDLCSSQPTKVQCSSTGKK